MTSYRGKYRLDFLQAIGYLISVILMVIKLSDRL